MVSERRIERFTTSDELIQEMTGKELKELLDIYTRLILTVDGLWFLGAEKKQGIEEAITMDEDVWREFGRISGARIGKYLSINPESIHDIADAILLSPMLICMGGTADVVDGRAYLSVTDCLPQKARVRKDMGEFPCKTVGTAYFEGLASGLNPDLRFRCVVCPPDTHSDDVWCRWELTITPKQVLTA